jgi:16S rRNA processing protein RimM
VLVVVGRIGRAQGIRGEVSVEPRTDEPERYFTAGSVLTTDPAVAGPLTVRAMRWQSGRLVVHFAAIDDRTRAESLRGVLLQAERDPAERPADPEEFYDRQLVGLAVVTVAGDPVGAVAEVIHLPAQDLLSVRRPDGREVLVPFVAALVPTVDLERGLVEIDPPGGLLDPEAADEVRPDPPEA